VLQYHFNWQRLSAAAGITWWNFYFRLYPDTIGAVEAVDFLAHLLRHLPGKLLVIWDRSRTHRSRLVADFAARQRGRLEFEYLAGLRAGTQSRGVPLGLLETSRTAQLLPPRLRPAKSRCPLRA
jgi:hypothetical protein